MGHSVKQALGRRVWWGWWWGTEDRERVRGAEAGGVGQRRQAMRRHMGTGRLHKQALQEGVGSGGLSAA